MGVCEEGGRESGLKGHVLLRAAGLAALTVVNSHTAAFVSKSRHASLVFMLIAHAALCPEAADLAQMQPCHFNQVYTVGS